MRAFFFVAGAAGSAGIFANGATALRRQAKGGNKAPVAESLLSMVGQRKNPRARGGKISFEDELEGAWERATGASDMGRGINIGKTICVLRGSPEGDKTARFSRKCDGGASF